MFVLLVLGLLLAAHSGLSVTLSTTSANSVDYSCLHATSWLLNNGDVSTIFNVLTDMTASSSTSDNGKAVSPSFSNTGKQWSVTSNRIPNYSHTVTASEVALLNSRPNKASDFKTASATTAVAGTFYQFGANIGFSTSSCSGAGAGW